MIVAPFYKKLHNSDNQEVRDRIGVMDWQECVTMMKNSFYMFNPPDYKFIMQTDLHTEVQGIDVHRTDHGDLGLMASIVKSNTDFVLSHCDKIILTGADHLFTGNVSRFFEEDFDIAFFIGAARKRVNNTAVLVNANESNKKAIDDFFIQRENVFFNEVTEQVQEWGGDQSSITDLLEKNGIISEYLKSQKRDFLFNGLKIKLYHYGEHFVKPSSRDGSYKIVEKMILLDFKTLERKRGFKSVYKNLMRAQVKRGNPNARNIE